MTAKEQTQLERIVFANRDLIRKINDPEYSESRKQLREKLKKRIVEYKELWRKYK